MQLLNTLTRRKEEVVPADDRRITMYFCGPTVYSHTHIGHLRPALVGDLIARLLRRQGVEVSYVRNITDVDDKIIQKSIEQHVSAADVAQTYASEYLSIMARMGFDQVDRYVSATENIPAIVRSIELLIEKGAAYEAGGDVYFAVEADPQYGPLSGRRLEEMIAGARVEVNHLKRNALDFALWKAAKPDEPSWESPWGPGRPGWHIECSVMCNAYLGETVDIHGGGNDLIFPHHENEAAQSRQLNGRPLARYWVHNGMVQSQGEKMSKSLGNFFTVNEALEHYSAQVVRMLLLATDYRRPLVFGPDSFADAARSLDRLTTTVRLAAERLRRLPGTHRVSDGQEAALSLTAAAGRTYLQFFDALADALNTAIALSQLFELGRHINQALVDPSFPTSMAAAIALQRASSTLVELGGFLGLLTPSSASSPAWVQQGQPNREAELIELLVQLRDRARAGRNWSEADWIRAALAQTGVVLEDGPDRTRWFFAEGRSS